MRSNRSPRPPRDLLVIKHEELVADPEPWVRRIEVNTQVVDEWVRMSDRESFLTARALARREGLLVGGSAGTAVAAALRYAARLTPSDLVVAILPDTGRNYLSKFYDDAWMRANGFEVDGGPRPASATTNAAEPPRTRSDIGVPNPANVSD